MKEFIVKSDGKQFKVKATDYENAIAAVKAVSAKDEATQLDVIQALVTDEQAAIAAYTNAIANLEGKVDPQYLEVLRNILKEENKHVENLQAIITGNVTAKNVEDANTSNAIAYGGYYIVNENGGWVVYDHDRQTAFAKYDSLQKAKLAINTGDIEEDYEATLMRHGKL